MIAAPACLVVQVLIEQASWDDRHCVAGVGAGLIEGHRVGGSKHPHVGNYRQIVFSVAVAVGGNVDHQTDVQLGPPVKHRLGVLGHPLAKLGGRGVIARRNSVMSTDPDAAAAADASALVDRGLMILPEADRPVGALFGAEAAANTFVRFDVRLAAAVLLHLSGAGTASHADVLDRAAEAGLFMPLEVVD